MYYECHITILGDPNLIRPVVEDIKWKFSYINGDPTLGNGIRCYATALFSDKLSVYKVKQFINSTAAELKNKGLTIVRQKIEKTLYDERTDTCDGNCCNKEIESPK